MERKVNYIKSELIKDGNNVPDLWNNLPRVPNPREFIDLEAQFEKTENEILELSENFAQLLQNFQELTELRYVLERTQVRLESFLRLNEGYSFIFRLSSLTKLRTWKERSMKKVAETINILDLLLV